MRPSRSVLWRRREEPVLHVEIRAVAVLRVPWGFHPWHPGGDFIRQFFAVFFEREIRVALPVIWSKA